MILIKEKIKGNEFFYESQVLDGNKIIATNSLKYTSFIREYKGKQYIIVYGPHTKPISEAFGFLNFYLNEQPINTKIKDMTALKLLYAYESILDKKLVDFTASDVESFKQFIEGGLGRGQSYKFDLITQRSNETINSYLASCRKYLSYLNQKNDYLNMKVATKGFTNPDNEKYVDNQRYVSNKKVGRNFIEVPRYISLEEFDKILKEIRKNYTIREEVIVRLMFENGLRLGEVLGLTFDDIVMEKIEYPEKSGELKVFPIVYIRNRVSDKPYQKAKRLLQVNDKLKYNSKNYKIKDYGYNQIIIRRELYDLINEYIDEYHAIAREKKKENYYKYTVADRVRKSEKFEEDNFYIFINSLGRPLSQTLWDGTIRKIFRTLNIEVDRDVKEHNLNHRFRHGFAMYNVKRGVKQLELMRMMRHNSLQSVARYYRPTLSDTIEIKTAFTEDLYSYIPELRREE